MTMCCGWHTFTTHSPLVTRNTQSLLLKFRYFFRFYCFFSFGFWFTEKNAEKINFRPKEWEFVKFSALLLNQPFSPREFFWSLSETYFITISLLYALFSVRWVTVTSTWPSHKMQISCWFFEIDCSSSRNVLAEILFYYLFFLEIFFGIFQSLSSYRRVSTESFLSRLFS